MKVPADGWDREERDAIEELHDDLEALQARHQHDPGSDLLRAGRHDALPPDLQSAAHDRLLSDPWTRTLVDGLEAAEPSLDAADQDRLLARIQRDAHRGGTGVKRWTWLRPVLATAALVVLGVAAWIAYRNPSSTSSASPVQPEQTIASTPTPPFQLPLDKPDVALSLSALTWRGASGDNQLLADLKAPLDDFREGDYTRADRDFTALETRYPQSIEVFFYGGVARLFLNDAERARAALARAGELADQSFAPRVDWYRAIAEHRVGRLAEARSRLDALCRSGSEYARQACRAVEQLESVSGNPNAR